jgi:hypothetical protein
MSRFHSGQKWSRSRHGRASAWAVLWDKVLEDPVAKGDEKDRQQADGSLDPAQGYGSKLAPVRGEADGGAQEKNKEGENGRGRDQANNSE